MINRLSRQQPFSPLLFCVFFGVLSIIASPPSWAQDAIPNNWAELPLENFFEHLQNMEGDSTLDRFRENARKEFVDNDVQTLQQKLQERRLSAQLGRYFEMICRGEIDEDEEQILRVLTMISPLERDYCKRAGEVLLQFGYETFETGVELEDLVIGTIPDDYVLGIGDQLIVTFYGPDSQTVETKIDHEGRVMIPNMEPLVASGRTFEEFTRNIEGITESTRTATDVFVSLGAIKNISVSVTGEAREPGVHQLTGLSTVLDAIAIAGGVKKTGSLRRIEVHRGDQIFWVDLYEFLFAGGMGHSIALREGDHIIVPTIGSTIAIGGEVKRPGVFELAEGKLSVSISEAISYAGGSIRPRGNRYTQITFDDSGRQVVIEQSDTALASNGDIVLVAHADDAQLGSVELIGHVKVPGRRSLLSAKTLRSLVGNPDNLKSDPYLLFAVLETSDPVTRSRQLFQINLQSIIGGTKDFTLRDQDKLIILSKNDVRYLASSDVQEILTRNPLSVEPAFTVRPGVDEKAGFNTVIVEDVRREIVEELRREIDREGILEGETEANGIDGAAEDSLQVQFPCRGLEILSGIMAGGRAERFANAIWPQTGTVMGVRTIRTPCPKVFDEYPNLLAFVLEHAVTVSGEVRQPGLYPIVNSTPFSSVVAVAGGVTREVDLTRVEIARYVPNSETGTTETSRGLVNIVSQGVESISVGPGDVIKFNSVFTDRDIGPVELSGEFIRPGFYEIRKGERLSEVILRAGGVSQQSYPYGAVFTRERVKRKQQLGFQRASRELNAAIAAAVVSKGVDPGAIQALRVLGQQLGSVEAVGRVVIESDPTVLQVRPELDIVLEPGDRLFMPKRPNSVLVIGDVLNPGALQFISGKKADQYIQQAGGFQKAADEDRVFAVYPNGEAQPLSVNVWNYSSVQIPPGSTIVVPKDPAPFDLIEVTKDVAELMSQLALTAASLAVITDN